jgi:hypothetical protein
VYATHNFVDPTTWFGNSVRVGSEAATDSGDGLTWTLVHSNVIDVTHGKVFDEEQYALDQQLANPGDPHGYGVVVTSDGVPQTPRVAFATSGGDYTVNHATGAIVFFSSQAGKAVLVSYSYAVGSEFVIAPDSGFVLDIESAKAAWSDDLEMTATVQFVVWGYAAVFAPQLGLPEGTKIPIQTVLYKTLSQLTGEAVAFIPFAIAPTGGSARGIAVARHVALFRYGTTRRLQSAAGIELRISVVGDVALGGAYAAATFYCVLRPEGET